MGPKPRLAILLALVAGVSASFVLGRVFRNSDWRRPQGQPGSALASVDHSDVTVVHRRPAPEGSGRAVPPRFTSSASVPPDQASQAALRATATQTVQELLAQVDTPIGKSEPQGAGEMKRAFLMGWVDALRYTSSALLDGITAEFRDRLCQTTTSDAELVFIGNLLQMVPEVATAEGYQCYFDRASNESVSLMTMLDAWRNSGLEPLAAIERMKNTNQDPEIQRWFATDPSLPDKSDLE